MSLSNLAKAYLDNETSEALANWVAFADRMDPYTTRKGDDRHELDSLQYYVLQQCNLAWSALYGNVKRPGEKSPSGNSEYAPYNKVCEMEDIIEKRLKELEDSRAETEGDFILENIRIQKEAKVRLMNYLRAELHRWCQIYEALNGQAFDYVPYEEKPKAAKPMGQSQTKRAELLAMISK